MAMGKRYACFTEEQQKQFDKLNANHKKYVIFRAQGMSKTDAYKMAGYADTTSPGRNSWKLENYKHPEIPDLVAAMSGTGSRTALMNPKSDASKELDKKVKKIEEEKVPPELLIPYETAKENEVVRQRPLEVEKLSDETAKNIHFFRQIAEGKIKSVKVTTNYDANGNIIGSKKEETSDIETRIKAQKELARLLGLKEVVEIGRATAGNINIMIVDASKSMDESKAVAPEELVTEAEEVDNGKETENSDTDSTRE